MTVSRKSLPPAPPPRWPGRRFNFVEVLADYGCLCTAVMESRSRCIDKDSCSRKISPESTASRGQRRHVGHQVKTPGPPPWLWHTGCYSNPPPHYLIGSLHGGTTSTFDGEIRGITGRILIGLTGSDTERSNARLKTWKQGFPALDLQHFGKSEEGKRKKKQWNFRMTKCLDPFLNERKQ